MDTGLHRRQARDELRPEGRERPVEEGVDVDLVETGGAPDAMPKVASGELDVTMRGPGLDFFLAEGGFG